MTLEQGNKSIVAFRADGFHQRGFPLSGKDLYWRGRIVTRCHCLVYHLRVDCNTLYEQYVQNQDAELLSTYHIRGERPRSRRPHQQAHFSFTIDESP